MWKHFTCLFTNNNPWFDINNYNSVVIQTYIKNSNFDTIIKEYKIIIGDVEDKLRQERDIVLPESITTNTDLRIIFNDTLKYDVTEMKTKWEGRYAQSFVGYQCTLVSYKLNGEENGEGNIYIDEPRFNLYWEKQLKKLW